MRRNSYNAYQGCGFEIKYIILWSFITGSCNIKIGGILSSSTSYNILISILFLRRFRIVYLKLITISNISFETNNKMSVCQHSITTYTIAPLEIKLLYQEKLNKFLLFNKLIYKICLVCRGTFASSSCCSQIQFQFP